PSLDRTYRELLTRVDAFPGVASASLARSTPLGPSSLGFLIAPPGGGGPVRLASTIVYPHYFATIGIPIVKRRDFGHDDLRAGAPRVVPVNEAFVRDGLKGSEPLGTGHGVTVAPLGVRFRPQGAADVPERLNIVGVVKDSHFPGLREPPAPTVYQTFLQTNTG